MSAILPGGTREDITYKGFGIYTRHSKVGSHIDEEDNLVDDYEDISGSVDFAMGLFQYKKGIQKKKPQPTPTPDPKALDPCHGQSAADLDYHQYRTYNDGTRETAKAHILRNHTVGTQISMGRLGPRKLEMLAGYLKKSLYGSNAYITDTELYDNIRHINSDTFDFGKRTARQDQEGKVTAIIFQYETPQTETTIGRYTYTNLGYIGVEFDPSTKTVSSSKYNTLILDPDCKTVQTSFPGRVPQ